MKGVKITFYKVQSGEDQSDILKNRLVMPFNKVF